MPEEENGNVFCSLQEISDLEKLNALLTNNLVLDVTSSSNNMKENESSIF